MYDPAIGDRVIYEPTMETGIIRSVVDHCGYCFVVYDRSDEVASLKSEWSAKRTCAEFLLLVKEATDD
jgi:hypothetical protein